MLLVLPRPDLRRRRRLEHHAELDGGERHAGRVRHLSRAPAGRAAGTGPGQRIDADVAWLDAAKAVWPAYTWLRPAVVWHVKHSPLSLAVKSVGLPGAGVWRVGWHC